MMHGIEVIDSWRATAMVMYIQAHLDTMSHNDLRKVCENYLKLIEEKKFIAYE